MAKWEDKDPKWIVQERQDGSNVNGEVKQQDKSQSVRSVGSRAPSANTGWHWEEKNQMGWSKQKLEELLVGMLVDMSAVQGNAKVTLLKDLKGEALLTTRKGKKRFAMYDLTITLAWEGLWVEDSNKQVANTVCTLFVSASWNTVYAVEWHDSHRLRPAAVVPGISGQVKGEIIIAEFASANEPEEYEWTVTAEGTGTAQDKLKGQVEALRSPVFEKLHQYTSALNSLV